ncbi:LacI family DNA-binding transcriptional regulator [Jiangella asiatica]|uniref:LacI family transcriptional regulator n=1 Tax=Jiangella asiatica TaxID=2530372 RepID=A0A4R5D802_9ACTN|nr:LacI family DNA-binding transcriptional regulator [Jiangella asiatica]TDE09672.1 LacI family transcriptional regulator [Jiangella asiatica]
MADVARLAGVSVITVSRVINDYPHVTPAVRQRVREAIAQLRYRPNTMARALVTNRSMHLGVITYALSVTSPSLALFGVSEEARAFGYSTNLVTLDDVSASSLQTALQHLADDAVDGAVLLAPMVDAPRALQATQAPMPVVSFEQGTTGSRDAVTLDEEFAAQLTTRHLLELGHHTVHFIRGPDGWMATEARETGWRRELALAGRRPPAPAPCADWGVASGYQAARSLLERGGVSAILVSNDAMCLGVYTALHEAGLTVPGDVSVVGFDDVPEAAYYQPPLTTVRLDFAAAGQAALRRLLGLLGVDAAGSVEAPTPTLVVRSSTAPPHRPSAQ